MDAEVVLSQDSNIFHVSPWSPKYLWLPSWAKHIFTPHPHAWSCQHICTYTTPKNYYKHFHISPLWTLICFVTISTLHHRHNCWQLLYIICGQIYNFCCCSVIHVLQGMPKYIKIILCFVKMYLSDVVWLDYFIYHSCHYD